MNRLLPPAVPVLTAEEVHADFHPRFDAKAKIYKCHISSGECVALFVGICPSLPLPLDEDRMVRLAGLWKASTISRSSPRRTTATQKAALR